MELDELEQNPDVAYPQKWKDIYISGAMEWLKHDYKWLNQNRDAVESNPSAFFYSSAGDCEPVPFCYIKQNIKELQEMISWDLQSNDTGKYLNPHYKIIPFAQMGSGDLYCFLFDDREPQAQVAVYGHDTGEVDLWAGNFDEFLYLQMVSAIVDCGEDRNSAAWRAHCEFLADEYKKKIMEQSTPELENERNAMGLPKAIDIFLHAEEEQGH